MIRAVSRLRILRNVGCAILAPGLFACSHGADKSAACVAAWNGRVAAIDAATKALDEAEAGVAGRESAARAAREEIEKQLVATTVRYEDRETYPEKLKGVVAKQKMRLAAMTPMKREAVKPAPAIRYDLEIQGEYKNVARTIAALYEQPKVFLFDRVEVNITDTFKKWSIVKAQGWVYELPPDAPAAVAAKPAPVADEGTPPECEGLPPPPMAEEVAGKRAALEARADARIRVTAMAEVEARVAARRALLADLLRRRDDNRAAFTSHSDELVRRAQGAVTLLGELRFKPNGEADWR